LRALLWLVVLLVSILSALGLVAYAILYAGAYLTGTDPNHPSQVPAMVRSFGLVLSSVAALGAYWGAVRLGENRQASELALKPLIPELGIGGAIGAGSMALVIGMLWAAGWVTVARQPVVGLGTAIGYAVASGVVEETVFRLIIFRLLWRLIGAWPALLASMIIFGAVHLTNFQGTLLGAVGTAIEGGLLSVALYMLTGRIWASIGEHSLWNFTQGWVFGAIVSGLGGFKGGPLITRPLDKVPDFLDGGVFGPEASIAAMALCAVAGGLGLWLASTRGRMSNDIGQEIPKAAQSVDGG
jgi:membrane protease YdiL (CAAX protease family)